MSSWSLDTICWHKFNAEAVDTALLAVVKTAALVEANAADYVTYLSNVFEGDDAFIEAAQQWGVEERQHGDALGRWAELADPTFSFARALADFRAGYKLDLATHLSIRGSQAAELIARQVVETGTSSFYSAMRDASAEPVLKEIAGRIAADEFHHYKLFAKHFGRYQANDRISLWAKLKVAATRFNEAEDDELGYAYFAANVLHSHPTAVFADRNYGKDYWARAISLYRRAHIDSAVRMIFRTVELKASGRLFRVASTSLWWLTRVQASRLAQRY